MPCNQLPAGQSSYGLSHLKNVWPPNMAVIYADLRFMRSPLQDSSQTEIPHALPYDEWEVTYENVNHLRSHGDLVMSSTETSSRSHTHRFLTFFSQLSNIGWLLSILLFLAVTIGLAVRLSLVSQHHDDTTTKLKQLQENHEVLKVSLSKDIHMKQATIQEREEILIKTKEELEKTTNILRKSQEELKRVGQRLENTIREKEKLQLDLQKCQTDLRRTNEQIEQKDYQLTSLDNKLKQVDDEKKKIEWKLKTTIYSLRDSEKKSKTLLNDLNTQTSELRNTSDVLAQTQSDLTTSKKNGQNLENELSSLRYHWKEAQQCSKVSCHGDNVEDKQNLDTFDYCPAGWQQIDNICYYFSTTTQVRYKSEEDCKGRRATLAKIGDNDHILKDMIENTSRRYWIGLKRDSIHENVWHWPDRTNQTIGRTRNALCVKAGPNLEEELCSAALPWICQKNPEKCDSKEKLLQCFGEKLGVFAEKSYSHQLLS